MVQYCVGPGRVEVDARSFPGIHSGCLRQIFNAALNSPSPSLGARKVSAGRPAPYYNREL
jgi:hypothetical protein